MSNQCDGCTQCCESLPIADAHIIKEAGVMCSHCDGGCTMYEQRPVSCKTFNCVYLDGLPLALRPDNCGVIFEKITTKIYLALTTNKWWHTPLIDSQIKQFNDQGISVVVASYDKGFIQAFTAEEHVESKVISIAMNIALQVA